LRNDWAYTQYSTAQSSSCSETNQLQEMSVLWGTFLIKDWDLALNGKCLQVLSLQLPICIKCY